MNDLDKKQSSEDYLERILMLREKGTDPIRAIDIANSFNYSRASISIALKKLLDEGLVVLGEHSAILLTEKGEAVAKGTYEKHLIIGKALREIGVPDEVAYEDACKIEHVISEETFEALKNHLDKKK
jgi:Mn-dependent DtxR family transcriptional regulator